MGWVIFIVWIVLAIFANIFVSMEENAETEQEKKSGRIGWHICMWIGISALGIGLLYLLGWIWYYFCCGFLVFEEPSFFWKIIWGAFTLIPLGFIIGIIAICCGWDPKDKWW